MRVLRGTARFCYDFLVGDDWKMAAAVAAALLLGGLALATGVLPAGLVGPLLAVLVAGLFSAALAFDVRRPPRS